ncbi:MAG: leucine-rich repeat domain-containing protein [Clostridia bacterium]|nr:leucine-rich repeat domain-containing protein [Clostridia bacterium]
MGVIRCEKCGSLQVSVNKNIDSNYSVKKGILGTFLFGAFGSVMGVGGKKKEVTHYHCQACGWQSTTSLSESECFAIKTALELKNQQRLQQLKAKYKNIEWSNAQKIGGSLYGSSNSTSSSIRKFDKYSFNELDWNNIVDLVVPNGVTEISNMAFYCHKKIETVIIPDSVVKIGKSAFAHCEKLKSVVLPKGLLEIGSSAFCGCTNLESIVIPDSVVKIGESAFDDCEKLKSVVLPKGLLEIGSSAFCGCTNLESIVIPDSVVKIGESTFDDCEKLKSVVLPKGLSEIGSGSFRRTNIESIIIPNTVVKLGSDVFSGTNIKELEIPNSVVEMEDTCVAGCCLLEKYNCPSFVKSINYKGCENLPMMDVCEGVEILNGLEKTPEELTLPSTLKRIGPVAFSSSCTNLKKIIITSELEFIGLGSLSSLKEKPVIIFTKLTRWEDEDGTVYDLTNNKETAALFSGFRRTRKK